MSVAPENSGGRLLHAMEGLRDALLKSDPAAIESAARHADELLRMLKKDDLTPEMVEQLAALNRRNGVLLAARQAAVQWALSRIAPPAAAVYGSDGQASVAPASRCRATA